MHQSDTFRGAQDVRLDFLPFVVCSYELSKQLEPPVDLCSPTPWKHRSLTKKLSRWGSLVWIFKLTFSCEQKPAATCKQTSPETARQTLNLSPQSPHSERWLSETSCWPDQCFLFWIQWIWDGRRVLRLGLLHHSAGKHLEVSVSSASKTTNIQTKTSHVWSDEEKVRFFAFSYVANMSVLKLAS